MKSKIKLYSVTSKSITKWGDRRGITVSFQKLEDNYVCFQGDGLTEGTIGWGETKEKAAANLIARKDYMFLYGVDGFAPIILKPL